MTRILVIVIGAVFAASSALADKPEWAGKGKDHDKSERHEKGKGYEKGRGDDQDRRGERGGRHFGEQHRVAVYEYYGEGFRGGRCPPGLAKKNNGCMPPGQAKKWRAGRPLPRDVVYYEVPQDLVVRLGPPPPGNRYVRVAADILLITVGTGMVVDAVQDLGRM
jgi:Ni/Co efflux regulator RcnB